MRLKSFVLISIFASLLLGSTIGVGAMGTASRIRAQDATQAATATANIGATATALVTQFKLTQTYHDDLYTVNYPSGWYTIGQPANTSAWIATDQKSADLVKSPSSSTDLPVLSPGAIVLQIANLSTISPGLTLATEESTAQSVPSTPAVTTEVPSTPSPTGIIDYLEREMSSSPPYYTFGTIQPFQLGPGNGQEVTLSGKNDDGLWIAFYSNGQAVIVAAVLPSGELPKDQPLIEAIASTIREAAPATVTPGS